METILQEKVKQPGTRLLHFADVKIRIIAFLIDNIIFCSVAGLLVYFFYNRESESLQSDSALGFWENMQAGVTFLSVHTSLAIILIIMHWLYYAVSESSVRQATPGKFALKLKVTSPEGYRISFLRASLRYVTKTTLFATASVGFWMSVFSPRKQMLHDWLSNCVLLKK